MRSCSLSSREVLIKSLSKSVPDSSFTRAIEFIEEKKTTSRICLIICYGCVRCIRTRWPNFRGPSSDLSLSSDLCHVRCACMAGHQYFNKRNIFWFSRGDRTGVARVLPLVCACGCVLCALFFLLSFLSNISIVTHARSTSPN